MDEVRYVNEIVIEFTVGLRARQGGSLNLKQRPELWKPPPWGAFKINVDAVFSKGSAAFACVVRDDEGLFVMASSSIDSISC